MSIQHYPKWIFHKTEAAKVIENSDELASHKAEGWRETPFAGGKTDVDAPALPVSTEDLNKVAVSVPEGSTLYKNDAVYTDVASQPKPQEHYNYYGPTAMTSAPAAAPVKNDNLEAATHAITPVDPIEGRKFKQVDGEVVQHTANAGILNDASEIESKVNARDQIKNDGSSAFAKNLDEPKAETNGLKDKFLVAATEAKEAFIEEQKEVGPRMEMVPLMVPQWVYEPNAGAPGHVPTGHIAHESAEDTAETLKKGAEKPADLGGKPIAPSVSDGSVDSMVAGKKVEAAKSAKEESAHNASQAARAKRIEGTK